MSNSVCGIRNTEEINVEEKHTHHLEKQPVQNLSWKSRVDKLFEE